jgi:peptide subunit release factor 1 (eRF1)
MRAGQPWDVLETGGPFASVYLDASHDTEDATHQDELRWQALRAELADLGADRNTIDAVGDVVLAGRPPVGRAGRCVVAADGKALVNEILPLPPANETARFSSLPYLVPLLAAAQPPVPYVTVVLDKSNGRFTAVDRHGQDMAVAPVQGSDHPVHSVSGGGMAHKKIENRAEETVRHNVKEVAARTTALAERISAELVIVLGDVQVRSALRAALPAHVRGQVTELNLDANAVETDPTVLTAAVDRLLAQAQAERELAAVERLRSGATHGLAVTGLAAVSKALRVGAVETLLVTEPLLGDRTVFIGSDRTQVATRSADLDSAETATEERADEALPIAASATSADVLVLIDEIGDPVADGVAALLRFAQ